ncbi:tetratricopeptide repeat protein [Geodermatophilus sp. SYSU D00758]
MPDWADPRDLDAGVRRALRGLEARNATRVAGHLVAAGSLVDEDPAEALAHARAARDRASRIAVVREAVGVAAYHAGDYAEAARELRAYRRMSGDPGYRAVLADCERAMGRPEVALRLVREALESSPDAAETVELRLVEAGARRDLGETAAARLVLEGALGGRPRPDSVDWDDAGTLRLASAYADLLTATGDEAAARPWQEAVAEHTPEDDVEFSEVEETVDEAGATPADEAPAPEGEAAATPEGEASEAQAEPFPAAAAGGDPAVHRDAGAGPARRPTFDEEVEAEVAELLGEDGSAPDPSVDGPGDAADGTQH